MNQIIQTIKEQKTEKYFFASIAVLFLIVGCVVVSLNTYYQVLVDGKLVGAVSNQAIYQSALEELKEEKVASTGLELVNIYNEMELASANGVSEKMDTEQLKTAIDQNVDWLVQGTKININNGETELVLATEQDGKAVLNHLKDQTTEEAVANGAKVKSVSFKEDVRTEVTNVRLSQILSIDDAITTIESGKEAIKIHTVAEKDSLWSIAHNNGLTLDEIQALNPEVGESYLQLGQEIKLTQLEPLLSVVTVQEVTRKEAIAHETETVTTDELLRGEQAVKQEGKDGKKSVTYEITQSNGVNLDKKVLAETVIEEPVKKVVEKGSGTVVIASSRSGSGPLSWPLHGRINSPYGNRSRGYHTGIDIDGNTGQNITAAAGGKVISAGWQGGYGLCVDIDHGNGVTTKYAHMSDINVSKGQSITRGSKVGEVGNTGNSTGPHLHFEVRVNGTHKNPMNYLN